jgi:hypothetical protein
MQSENVCKRDGRTPPAGAATCIAASFTTVRFILIACDALFAQYYFDSILFAEAPIIPISTGKASRQSQPASDLKPPRKRKYLGHTMANGRENTGILTDIGWQISSNPIRHGFSNLPARLSCFHIDLWFNNMLGYRMI